MIMFLRTMSVCAVAAVLVGAAWLAGPGAAVAGESARLRTITLQVDYMTCSTCPFIVRKSLEQVAGTESAEVSLETESAVVVYDPALTGIPALIAATTNAGCPSRLLAQVQ